MFSTGDERQRWESDVLDFLSWRGAGLFTNWTPRTSVDLVRELGGPDWESLLVRNLAASPNLERDLARAAQIAGRELVHDRAAHRVRTRGRLRGRVLARDTVRARLRSADPTLWVTEAKRREWQTEANAAIAGFLDHLRRSFRTAAVSAPNLGGLEAVERLLSINPLRHVTPDAGWSTFNMPPWLTAKNEFYRLIWSWADALRRSRRTRDALALRDMMGSGWLAAESRDKLFELFALSRASEALHRAAAPWDRFEIRLPAGAAKVGIKARADTGWTARVRFDRKPPVLGTYGQLLSNYAGVDGRGRRPDLQLELRWRGCRAVTLIEVKDTEPNSTYGRDSVVKVFGYLKDYWRLWMGAPSGFPKAVLLYSGDPKPIISLEDRMATDEVVLSSPDTFDADLTEIIEAQMKALGIPQHQVPPAKDSR